MLRKRGNIWHARFGVTGKLYEFSTGQTKKSLALQVATERRREILQKGEDAVFGVVGRKPVTAVIDQYLEEISPTKAQSTARREREILRQVQAHFRDELGDPEIGKVKPAHISALLDWKASTGVANRTVNLYRSVLHNVFELAIDRWEYVEVNPVRRVKKRKEAPREPRILNRTELEALIDAAHDPMLHLFVLLLSETGMRSESEALKLRWDDLDFANNFIEIRSDEGLGKKTKTGRSRSVPMSKRARQALTAHAAAYRWAVNSDWVFCHLTPRASKKGGVQRGARIERMYRGFMAACARAGIAGVRPHDLRHTFITHKIAEGHSAALVQRVVGHENLATTMKYTHLVKEDLRSVMEPVAHKSVG